MMLGMTNKKPERVWAKVFNSCQCTNCGKWKTEKEFGRSIYYARVCNDCQSRFRLCPECGGKIEREENEEFFACTGYHCTKGEKLGFVLGK